MPKCSALLRPAYSKFTRYPAKPAVVNRRAATPTPSACQLTSAYSRYLQASSVRLNIGLYALPIRVCEVLSRHELLQVLHMGAKRMHTYKYFRRLHKCCFLRRSVAKLGALGGLAGVGPAGGDHVAPGPEAEERRKMPGQRRAARGWALGSNCLAVSTSSQTACQDTIFCLWRPLSPLTSSSFCLTTSREPRTCSPAV